MTQITFSKHPEYIKLSPKWIKWRDLYEGDHDVLRSPSYLFMHELEDQRRDLGEKAGVLRAIREQRSRILNLTEPVVSRWQSFLFRKPPTVPESIRKMFGDDDYRNVTGSGVGFESFIRDHVGKNYLAFGKPVIYVDTSGVHARTLAEAKALGSRPFMEVLDPLEIPDWQLSDDPKRVGKLDWIRTEFELLEPRTSPTEKPVLRRYSKVIAYGGGRYTITVYRAKDAKGTAATAGVEWEQFGEPLDIAGWDGIPVAHLCGESFIKDVAEQQLALFNLMSAESSVLNYQAFRQVFIIGNQSEPAKMRVGEYVWNFLAEGSTVFALEPVATDSLSRAIERTKDQLFKVAFNQVNSLSSDSKEAPSAETRRQMKDEFTALVETSLTEIEDLINEAVVFWGKFKGVAITERVTFDKRVSDNDFTEFVTGWAALRDLYAKIPEVQREIMLKGADHLGLGEESIAAIKDFDIEAEQKKAEAERTAMLRGLAGTPEEESKDGDAGTEERPPAG